MGFKHPFLPILLRVLILLGLVLMLGYSYFQTGLVVTPLMMGIAVLIAILELSWYLQKRERNWIRFLESIKYQDFNRAYQKQTSKELSEAFDLITSSMEELKTRNQTEFRVLQTLIGHLSIGILCYRHTGEVIFTNKAFDNLLEIDGLIHVEKLQDVFPALFLKLEQSGNIGASLIEDENGKKLLVKTESFKLKGTSHTLVSLSDIRNPLDEKELESYQVLMRVMTHEIMNSANPILSLVTVINKKLINGDQLSLLSPKDQQNIVKSLLAVEERTDGLLKFVAGYKEINRSITPHIQEITSSEFISQVTPILAQLSEFEILIEDHLQAVLHVDISLVNQVLINLIKNSIAAISTIENGQVGIRFFSNNTYQVIEVNDNGPGVSPENLHRIFVPFYTTKTDGSGIGLSISRKIIKAHQGYLGYDRHESESIFRIRLPLPVKG